MTKTCYVYVLASARSGTLYIGMTNNLSRRMREHKESIIAGFSKKYGVKTSVYYEVFEQVNAAIHRETRLEKYKREWKINLIEQNNPDWRDLADTL